MSATENVVVSPIASDGSISADWLAMTLADDARIEGYRLANAEYLAVRIAQVSDLILARALTAERERDEAWAEVERLREALQPFAALVLPASEWQAGWPDYAPLDSAMGARSSPLTIGHCRNARAALNPEKTNGD